MPGTSPSPQGLHRLSLPIGQVELQDTIPPSKEKLQLLSKTRPAWLPPKSKVEERRHLAEFDKIVSLSKISGKQLFCLAQYIIIVEHRKEEARLKSEISREMDIDQASHMWTKEILPNWDMA